MKDDLNYILEVLDELYPYAFGWLCAVLIIGSIWFELAMRRLG